MFIECLFSSDSPVKGAYFNRVPRAGTRAANLGGIWLGYYQVDSGVADTHEGYPEAYRHRHIVRLDLARKFLLSRPFGRVLTLHEDKL